MAKFKLLAGIAFFVLGLRPVAQAVVTVNLPPPVKQYTTTDTTFTLYQAGGANASPPVGYINSNSGYRYIMTSAIAVAQPQNWIYIDVYTDHSFSLTGNERIGVMLSTDNSAGNEIPIHAAGTKTDVVPAQAPGGCACNNLDTTNSRVYVANYTPGSVLRIAVSLDDICTTASSSGTLCGGSGTAAYTGINDTPAGTTMKSQNITVTFAKVRDANVSRISFTDTTLSSDLVNQAFTLYVTDIAPSVSCPGITAAQFYFPGDQQIYLNTGNLQNGTSTRNGPPVDSYLFLARIGSTPGTPVTGPTPGLSDVQPQLIPASSDQQVVTGFANATSAGDTSHAYSPAVYSQNTAGILSSNANSCIPNLFTVQAQPITGVLTESKCFIATAAYHDGRAAPVMMLRRFRDRILARHEWGRKFIESYYEHSPAWAQWAWDKPVIRSLALKLLTPLELAAWFTLKLSGAEQLDAPSSSPEPYIDRLRQLMPPKTSSGSYTEEQKKNLEQAGPQPETSAGYSQKLQEELKKTSPSTDEGSKDYSLKEQALLPPEKYHENPSELVKKGRDRKLGMPDVPPITSAVSLRMGVNPGVEVSGAVTNTFSNIYGGGWQPELLIHYERQFLHSENFGSLALTADTGISYAEGFGRLLFPFNGTQISQTKFSFLQIPLLLGANYRFNLFRLLRPYAGAGVGSMFYAEIRKDNAGDKRGYSFIYDVHGGLALEMDFLDRETSRESYLSQGVQHTYLFAEYAYMNTLSGNVRFGRAGIYLGFLFEL